MTHAYDRENTHWRTRDGELLTPATMTDDHLRNLIRFLERNARAYIWQEIKYAYSFLYTLNGELAQDCVEYDIAILEDLLYEGTREDHLEFVKQKPIYICVMNEIAYRQYLKEPQWVTDTTTDSTASNAEMWTSWQEFLADLMLRTWGLESPIKVWRLMRLSTLTNLRSSLHHLEL
jgi:hypothetical protein